MSIDLEARMPEARIGLLPTGHFYYWDQFPKLKKMGLNMYTKLRKLLDPMADIVAPELVDTMERSRKAGELFKKENVDKLREVLDQLRLIPEFRGTPYG